LVAAGVEAGTGIPAAELAISSETNDVGSAIEADPASVSVSDDMGEGVGASLTEEVGSASESDPMDEDTAASLGEAEAEAEADAEAEALDCPMRAPPPPGKADEEEAVGIVDEAATLEAAAALDTLREDTGDAEAAEAEAEADEAEADAAAREVAVALAEDTAIDVEEDDVATPDWGIASGGAD
jgi:hypothetical protein